MEDGNNKFVLQLIMSTFCIFMTFFAFSIRYDDDDDDNNDCETCETWTNKQKNDADKQIDWI